MDPTPGDGAFRLKERQVASVGPRSERDKAIRLAASVRRKTDVPLRLAQMPAKLSTEAEFKAAAGDGTNRIVLRLAHESETNFARPRGECFTWLEHASFPKFDHPQQPKSSPKRKPHPPTKANVWSPRRRNVPLVNIAIIFLIAYELLRQANLRKLTNINPFAAESESCQLCLPNPIYFIRDCSATSILLPLDERRLSGSQNGTSAGLIVAAGGQPGADKSDGQTFSPAEAAFNGSHIGPNVGAKRTDSNHTNSTAQQTLLGTSTPPMDKTADNMTFAPSRRNVGHSANVLCNSRCSCVVLKPISFAIAAAATPTTTPSQGSQLAEQPIGSDLELNLVGDTERQPANNISKVLIAFNEDYSLDYEQAGGGSGEEADEVDDELAAASAGEASTGGGSGSTGLPLPMDAHGPPAASGNGGDRMLAQQADQSNASIRAIQLAAATQTSAPTALPANQSQSQSKVSGSATRQPPLAGLSGPGPRVGGGSFKPAMTNPSDVHVVGSAFRQPQLQAAATAHGGQQNNTTTQTTTNATATQAQQHQAAMMTKQAGLIPFPLSGHHRHLHQLQHHHPDSASASQLYAQSLYSSQAPKLSYHAHKPFLISDHSAPIGPNQQSFEHNSGLHEQSHSLRPHPIGAGASSGGLATYSHHHLRQNHLARQLANNELTNQNRLSARKLVPLKVINMSRRLRLNSTSAQLAAAAAAAATSDKGAQDGEVDWSKYDHLIETIESMLISIEQDDIQSLVLRSNRMQFELWSELYALLAVPLRRNLFHLDLSHNSLSKLGITFTGYIEHYLSSHNSWPFNVAVQQQQQQQQNGAAPLPNRTQSSELLGSTNSSSLHQARQAGGGRSKHTLVSGGQLFTLIRKRLANRGADVKWGQASNSSLLQQSTLIRALDLSHNKLKWLINDQFRALKHVQTIRLDFNRIRYIHQHAFSGLESLRFLNLNSNRLQVIYIEQFHTNYNLLVSFSSR